jgi:hypothetical protein
MMQPDKKKEEKGVLEKLPRLGRTSQLILLVGVFLVIFVPMLLFYQGQQPKQTEARATLANMQKILSVSETPKAKFEAELAQANAETEAAKASFPRPDQAPEILDSLLAQADENDIIVTRTQVTSATPSGSIGPVLTITIGLKGQIPKFQNFLLGIDSKLPTSEIKTVTFTTAELEGEYDTATIVLSVLCYGGS